MRRRSENYKSWEWCETVLLRTAGCVDGIHKCKLAEYGADVNSYQFMYVTWCLFSTVSLRKWSAYEMHFFMCVEKGKIKQLWQFWH